MKNVIMEQNNKYWILKININLNFKELHNRIVEIKLKIYGKFHKPIHMEIGVVKIMVVLIMNAEIIVYKISTFRVKNAYNVMNQ